MLNEDIRNYMIELARELEDQDFPSTIIRTANLLFLLANNWDVEPEGDNGTKEKEQKCSGEIGKIRSLIRPPG